MKLKDLIPKIGQHCAFIGQTGCGKSTAARAVLKPIRGPLAIFDPKRDFKYELVDPTLPVFETMREVWRRKPRRFVYRPKPELLGNAEEMDSFFRYCYENAPKFGGITVYVDDAVGVVKQHKPPHFLLVCYTMGRSRGLRMISCFQRPANLPLVMTSEATKYFVWRLAVRADVERVKQYCIGYSPELLRQHGDRHTFFFYDPDMLETAQMSRINF